MSTHNIFFVKKQEKYFVDTPSYLELRVISMKFRKDALGIKYKHYSMLQ